MTTKEKCLELINTIEQDYYDSLLYFYKKLYELFENNKKEDD